MKQGTILLARLHGESAGGINLENLGTSPAKDSCSNTNVPWMYLAFESSRHAGNVCHNQNTICIDCRWVRGPRPREPRGMIHPAPEHLPYLAISKWREACSTGLDRCTSQCLSHSLALAELLCASGSQARHPHINSTLRPGWQRHLYSPHSSSHDRRPATHLSTRPPSILLFHRRHHDSPRRHVFRDVGSNVHAHARHPARQPKDWLRRTLRGVVVRQRGRRSSPDQRDQASRRGARQSMGERPAAESAGGLRSVQDRDSR